MATITVHSLKEKKYLGEKLTMVTVYDYPSAKMVEEAGIEMILVGDSLGMALLGYDNTLPVTMDEMIYHTKAVTRGVSHTFVIADMPFLSYHLSVEESVANAGRFLKEAGAHAVKLEGGKERLEVITAIISAGIPVLGHLGLMPQSVHQMGGFKVQGKSREQAQQILLEAKLLEKAGVFGLILECIPAPLAKVITQEVSVPTIGIGAGPHCDGQVLVWHDLLGITQQIKPRFVKQYADLHGQIHQALVNYKKEVESGDFPQKEHSFTMSEEDIPGFYTKGEEKC